MHPPSRAFAARRVVCRLRRSQSVGPAAPGVVRGVVPRSWRNTRALPLAASSRSASVPAAQPFAQPDSDRLAAARHIGSSCVVRSQAGRRRLAQTLGVSVTPRVTFWNPVVTASVVECNAFGPRPPGLVGRLAPGVCRGCARRACRRCRSLPAELSACLPWPGCRPSQRRAVSPSPTANSSVCNASSHWTAPP